VQPFPRFSADDRIAALPDDREAPARGPPPGARPLPPGRPGTRAPAAGGRGRGADGRAPAAPARQHLHRRDHPRVHLLLLRRDARRVPVPGAQGGRRVPHQAGEREAGRLRRVGVGEAAGEGKLARAEPVRRDDGRHPHRHRREHRAHLPRELPEPGGPHLHQLRADRPHPERRGDPAERVHRRRRRDHPRNHRARRPLQLQRRAAAGEACTRRPSPATATCPAPPSPGCGRRAGAARERRGERAGGRPGDGGGLRRERSSSPPPPPTSAPTSTAPRRGRATAPARGR
jgi:hypothetical protein